jgi:hypothetical protein
MNWRGQIIFTFHDGRDYVFKAKGSFDNKFVIEKKTGEKLIQFNPEFTWKSFDYNYEITYDENPPDLLLVLLGVYASNYSIAAMLGAG